MSPLFAYYDSPFGTLEIGYGEAIVSLQRVTERSHPHAPSALSDLAAAELREYFLGHRTAFDIPLSPSGTPFQLAVWQVLRDIPYGETRSYGQIAAAIGNPRAVRAVGTACGRNPIWVMIPCHRVIGAEGALTGYAGGLEMKKALLDLENP